MRDWNPEGYKATYVDVFNLINSKWFYFLSQRIKPNSTILEVGCGSGKWSAAFAVLGHTVTCSDSLNEMLNQVKKNFPYIKMKYLRLKIPIIHNTINEKFDVIFNEGTIEHFLDKEKRIEAINDLKLCLKKKRALYEGGKLMLSMPYYIDNNAVPEDEHKYENKEELSKECIEAGFKKTICYDVGSGTKKWIGVIAW